MPADEGDSSPRRPDTEDRPGGVRTEPHPGSANAPMPPVRGAIPPIPSAEPTRPSSPAPSATSPSSASSDDEKTKKHHDHHVLIDAEEDRWAWRRKIRRNPRQLAVYRVAVALAGLFMIALGAVTGPLPGPGGIPLVLLGLAIWASEFEWAHKVMLWFKAQMRRYRSWPLKYQLLFWVIFFVVCATLGYSYLLLMGVPFWAPQFVTDLLERLPGV